MWHFAVQDFACQFFFATHYRESKRRLNVSKLLKGNFNVGPSIVKCIVDLIMP